jgi:hypothetical protein
VENRYFAHVGHLQLPTATLALGGTRKAMAQAVRHVEALTSRLDPDGVTRYRVGSGQVDYARTHWANEASGYAGDVAALMLRSAVFSGEPRLVARALGAVDRLDRFRDGVPRGAQTWEIALHTPDILASAHLVRAYTLAYQLTGEECHLDAARYWAWTGVPFVYLANPTDQPIGPYATIAVLGATNWKDPNWIGRPVQWCGAVYAQGLVELAAVDPSGPWSTLARGITASGLQQGYPAEHPSHGLLPDSVNLLPQTRNPADINPGTLQPLALKFLTGVPDMQVIVARAAGLTVLAPGQVKVERARPDRLTLDVTCWKAGGVLVVHGLPNKPNITRNGQQVVISENGWIASTGTVLLPLPEATSRVDLDVVAENVEAKAASLSQPGRNAPHSVGLASQGTLGRRDQAPASGAVRVRTP